MAWGSLNGNGLIEYKNNGTDYIWIAPGKAATDTIATFGDTLNHELYHAIQYKEAQASGFADAYLGASLSDVLNSDQINALEDLGVPSSALQMPVNEFISYYNTYFNDQAGGANAVLPFSAPNSTGPTLSSDAMQQIGLALDGAAGLTSL